MSAADAPTAGETITEIADRYGRARPTVSIKWSLRPDWPDPIGKRGYAYLYDPEAVDDWFNRRPRRPAAAVDWIPEGLYSLRDIAAATGMNLSAVRSRVARGSWPAADDTSGKTYLWFGSTIAAAISRERALLGPRECT